MKKTISLLIAVIAIAPCMLLAQIRKPLEVKTQQMQLKKPLKITSHADGQDAYGVVQILGTGEPGLDITVSLYAFAEVTPKKNRSAWSMFKAISNPVGTVDFFKNEMKKRGTQIKERHFITHKVTIDKNGKWYIPVFQSFGSTDWMRNAFIPFAWTVSAMATDPNYREGNRTTIRLGCKM